MARGRRAAHRLEGHGERRRRDRPLRRRGVGPAGRHATASDGVTFWGIPADLAPRTDYQIRITDLANAGVFDESDAAFTIAPVPTADFVAAPVEGVVPLTVTFTDTSTSLVDAWGWGFGDGITSTVQNPSHVYSATGVYTVSLSVAGPTGSDAITRTNAITVTPPPLPRPSRAPAAGYPAAHRDLHRPHDRPAGRDLGVGLWRRRHEHAGVPSTPIRRPASTPSRSTSLR